MEFLVKKNQRLTLRALEVKDQLSFLAAINDFEAVDPGWEFAFQFDSRSCFSSYVDIVAGWSQGIGMEHFVPNSYLVAVVGDSIVGRVSIRHRLNEHLMRDGGHIGYGVVPKFRKKGYAKEILNLSLNYAKQLGLSKVLLTTDDDNVGSIRTIEFHGGVLKITENGKRKYWISL